MRPPSAALRFVIRALVLAGVLYGVIYFPYRTENLVVRVLSGYLRAIASVAGGLIGRFRDRQIPNRARKPH